MVTFNAKQGQVALDQIRVIDRVRIVKHVGRVTAAESQAVLRILQEMFA